MSNYTQMWSDLGLDLEATLEEFSIPTLRLETDYSQEDAGQIKTRIEAFRERIQAR